jgi:hypothetical protein
MANWYFRVAATGMIQRLTLEDGTSPDIPDGWTYLPDGAELFAAQSAGAEAQRAEAEAALVAEQHAKALERMATLDTIVSAINTANPDAALTRQQLLDALAGTPADWAIVESLLP